MAYTHISLKMTVCYVIYRQHANDSSAQDSLRAFLCMIHVCEEDTLFLFYFAKTFDLSIYLIFLRSPSC